jgi:hypothetical protein
MVDRFTEDRKQVMLAAVREVYDEMERRERQVQELRGQSGQAEPTPGAGQRDGSAAPTDENLHLTNIEAGIEDINDTVKAIAASVATIAETPR